MNATAKLLEKLSEEANAVDSPNSLFRLRNVVIELIELNKVLNEAMSLNPMQSGIQQRADIYAQERLKQITK